MMGGPTECHLRWSAMLELIYAGHSDLAWKIWEEAWPKNKPAKSGFLGAFCERLTQSPYFYEFYQTLTPTPPDYFSIRTSD